MQVGGSCDERHCHGLTGIAGYIVVRTRPGSGGDGGAGEIRADLAVLEGNVQITADDDTVLTLYRSGAV